MLACLPQPIDKITVALMSGTALHHSAQDTPLDSDREADAARLDDAEATGDGISDQDFTRGKRFRKLHRVLISTAVSGPVAVIVL
jgi:hypothetical protein